MSEVAKNNDKKREKAAAVTLLESRKEELAKLCGPMIEQFMGSALSCLTKTPKLLQCRPGSFVQAAHHCAVLGLLPGPTDDVYLIPYGKEVHAQVGYKGYITLATRHPEIKKCDGKVIYKGDLFNHNEVTHHIDHQTDWRASKKDEDVEGAWAAVWRHDDPLDHPSFVLVLNREQIEERRNKSKQAKGNFWTDHYPAMCRKTVIRALLNGGSVPKHTQLAQAIEYDLQHEEIRPAEVAQEASAPLGTPVEDAFEVDIDVEVGEPDPLEQLAEETLEAEPKKPLNDPRLLDEVFALMKDKKWTKDAVHSIASDIAGRVITDITALTDDELEQLRSNL